MKTTRFFKIEEIISLNYVQEITNQLANELYNGFGIVNNKMEWNQSQFVGLVPSEKIAQEYVDKLAQYMIYRLHELDQLKFNGRFESLVSCQTYFTKFVLRTIRSKMLDLVVEFKNFVEFDQKQRNSIDTIGKTKTSIASIPVDVVEEDEPDNEEQISQTQSSNNILQNLLAYDSKHKRFKTIKDWIFYIAEACISIVDFDFEDSVEVESNEVEWGMIIGDISNQVDLMEYFSHYYTKEATDTKLDTKLDKVSGETNYMKVYVKTKEGEQGVWSASETIGANCMVIRDGQQIKVPLTPSADNDSTSKKYVDDTKVQKLSIGEGTMLYMHQGSVQGQISVSNILDSVETMIDNKIEEKQSDWFGIGRIVGGDDLIDEETVISKFGGTHWENYTDKYIKGIALTENPYTNGTQSLPNISGVVFIGYWGCCDWDSTSNPFYVENISNWPKNYPSSEKDIAGRVKFDLSRSNSVFKNNAKVNCDHIGTYIWKRIS